jgi:hypothetical protein
LRTAADIIYKIKTTTLLAKRVLAFLVFPLSLPELVYWIPAKIVLPTRATPTIRVKKPTASLKYVNRTSLASAKISSGSIFFIKKLKVNGFDYTTLTSLSKNYLRI